MSETVYVSLDLSGQTVAVGTAYFTRRNNVVSTSFRYSEDYLSRPDGYAIDPAMPLTNGNHATASIPGAFADCSPDRWGQNLIAKAVSTKAQSAGRTAPGVSEIDYLLGVSDLTRQGALRFRTEPDGPFLNPDLAVPKLIELPRLLQAANTIALDTNDMAAIADLLDAGSGSLGGARPKASVRDGDRLLIAKFPHPNDDWDVMAWEKTALDLAELAGIKTPRRELTKVAGKAVLMLDRFDRDQGKRGAYISAMTVVQGSDGASADYLDLAETLTELSSRTAEDLRDLWRRIAFSIAIHNTDDHFRNHGFLRHRLGWTLSPIFDVNANPDTRARRVTGICGAHSRNDELVGLMGLVESCRVKQEAKGILRQVLTATASWRQVARRNGVAARELTGFADTFDGLREPMEKLAR